MNAHVTPFDVTPVQSLALRLHQAQEQLSLADTTTLDILHMFGRVIEYLAKGRDTVSGALAEVQAAEALSPQINNLLRLVPQSRSLLDPQLADLAHMRAACTGRLQRYEGLLASMTTAMAILDGTEPDTTALQPKAEPLDEFLAEYLKPKAMPQVSPPTSDPVEQVMAGIAEVLHLGVEEQNIRQAPTSQPVPPAETVVPLVPRRMPEAMPPRSRPDTGLPPMAPLSRPADQMAEEARGLMGQFQAFLDRWMGLRPHAVPAE